MVKKWEILVIQLIQKLDFSLKIKENKKVKYLNFALKILKNKDFLQN